VDGQRHVFEFRGRYVPVEDSSPSGARENQASRRVDWGEPVDCVRLGIVFSRERYRRGEPVSLEVLISNDGITPVTVVESHFLADHDIDVETPEGVPVGWTTEGDGARQRARQGVWGRRTIAVPPGTQYRVVPDRPLDAWVRLDVPGRYRVHISRRDWHDRGRPLESRATLEMTY